MQTISSVGARNVQHIQAVVLVDVDVLGSQALTRPADGAVYEYSRRDGVGAADRRALDQPWSPAGLAAIGRIATCRSERWRVEQIAGRHAVPGEQSPIVRRVVVHFDVRVVAREGVGARSEVVIGESRCRLIYRRQQRDQFQRGRIEAVQRDTIIQEWRASSPVGTARARVIDGGPPGKVSLAQRIRGNRPERRRVLPPQGPLPVAEEEQFVLLDRSAESSPELVRDVLGRLIRIAGTGVQAVKIVSRLQVAVAVELVRAAVKLIGARLDLYVDDSSSCHALLGIETIRYHVHRLHGIGGRHVSDQVRQPRIADRRAIQARAVIGFGYAVDIANQRLLRVARIRVLIGRRGEARYQFVELLEIAAGGNGEVSDLGVLDLRIHVRPVSLQREGGRLHRYRSDHAGELQAGVQPLHGIGVYHDTFQIDGPERRRGNRDRIRAGLQIGEQVRPPAIAGGLFDNARIGVERFYLRSGNAGVANIGNGTS